ncbi:MAG: hypothetical protein PF444_06190 [Bacteroidales bacterium]|jgi:hypothetical protein|nr:hypothetical protein [Bacteroidales bacterium]
MKYSILLLFLLSAFYSYPEFVGENAPLIINTEDSTDIIINEVDWKLNPLPVSSGKIIHHTYQWFVNLF